MCLDVDDPEKTSAIEAFLHVAVDSTLESVRALAPAKKSIRWQELWTTNWMATAGTIEVVECGSAGPIIHLDQIDAGAIKYTPKVEELSIRLFACIETKLALLVECELRIRRDEGPPGNDEQRRQQYQRIVEATNALSQSSGNAEDLEDACAALSLAASSYASLQKTSAADRSGRACFEGPRMGSDELVTFLDAVASTEDSDDNAEIDLEVLEGDGRPRVRQLVAVCQMPDAVPTRLAELGLHAGTLAFAAWFVQREEGESFGRAAESELRRQLQLVVQQEKREKREKRAETDILPGTMSTFEALEVLREDRLRTVDDSTTRETKKSNRTDRYRDLTITACASCGTTWCHPRDKFIDSSRDMHACPKPKWLSTRPLFTSSLLYLLPAGAEELKRAGPNSSLPKFRSVKVRDVLPQEWIPTLPWQSGLDAEITLPEPALASSLPEIQLVVIVAGLDRLVIDRVETAEGHEYTDRIRACKFHAPRCFPEESGGN